MKSPALLLQVVLPLLTFPRRVRDILWAFLLLLRVPIPPRAPDRHF